MQECIIGGNVFEFVENAIVSDSYREPYFELTEKIFKLDFHPWFESGYCDGFTPYTLFDNGIAAASVGAARGCFKSAEGIIRYTQISTVMTLPPYRGMNLNKYLLEYVLNEWKDKSDMIYLYANDSVLDYYPKFGFKKAVEYAYSIPLFQKQGKCRKLDLKISEDRELFTKYYRLYNNPFLALQMEENLSMIMFHCITFLYNNIYYVEDFDAVVIAEIQDNKILCYDIYTQTDCSIEEILGVLATKDIIAANFGFMPKNSKNYICEQSTEKNKTIFVLDPEKSIFSDNKMTLPFLSWA